VSSHGASAIAFVITLWSLFGGQSEATDRALEGSGGLEHCVLNTVDVTKEVKQVIDSERPGRPMLRVLVSGIAMTWCLVASGILWDTTDHDGT